MRIDTETHALRADGSIIEGLYCAGEIVGGIHGGNRLGGNAIVDFCVFGRLAAPTPRRTELRLSLIPRFHEKINEALPWCRQPRKGL